ncbi:MAG: hypothetical protein RLZ84_1736, partial [Actinomycetota bacterium]
TVIDGRVDYYCCVDHTDRVVITSSLNNNHRWWGHEVVWWSSDTSNSHQFLFLDVE